MEQVVECSTRGENILDLFFTTHPALVESTNTLPPLGKGDHDIVLCDTLITPNRVKKPRRNILLWKKADEDGIKTALIKSQTDIIDNSNDVNKTWDKFRTTIEDIMKKYIPTKLTSTRNSHPWINRNINKLTRKKNRAHKKARSTKKSKDWNLYTKLKSACQREIRKSHDSYLQDIVSGNMKNNSKKLWSYIKHKKQDSSGVAPLKDTDGLLHSDTPAKPEILNNQFRSVYTKEDFDNLPSKGPSPHPTMPNIQVNSNGIKKLLKGLNIHKATGPDAIPTIFLHDYVEELAPIMTFIFQLSLDTGNIPDDWRKANMVVLFKKGDRHQASNYRPVSLTSVSCKILEHVIHSQIMDHFDRWNILTDKQHGFRRRRSCES